MLLLLIIGNCRVRHWDGSLWHDFRTKFSEIRLNFLDIVMGEHKRCVHKEHREIIGLFLPFYGRKEGQQWKEKYSSRSLN
jgi:hypothetical protein